MKRAAMIAMILVFGICCVGHAAGKMGAEKKVEQKIERKAEQKVAAKAAATREECVAKTREAAEMIRKEGVETAIAELRNEKGRFVWKDSYVFLMTLEGRMLAHPMDPGLTEEPSVLSLTDGNLENPKPMFREFVKVALDNGEGWVDYVWPRPGEDMPVLKETHIYRVPGKNLILGAGIYN